MSVATLPSPELRGNVGVIRNRQTETKQTYWTTGYLTHVSEDISAPRTRINLPIAALELCYKAGHFEYNKAYI